MSRNETILQGDRTPERRRDTRSLGRGVLTQGEDWEDLKGLVREAVHCSFGDDDSLMKPSSSVSPHKRTAR